jgi:conjugal transfer pilus assembly protein TraV
MKALALAITLMISAAITGCSSMASPYGGESTFNCSAKFMEGVPCDSITGTAKNYEAGKLKWQQKDGSQDAPSAIAQMQSTAALPPIQGPIQEGRGSAPMTDKQSPRQMAAISTGFPLRTPDRVLRIWMAPYEDEEGALNDQKYVYLTVSKGGWQIEANRKAIQVPYKQIFPLGRARKDTPEIDVAANRASSRNQAQAAVISNPNLTNMPAQPQAQEVEE